MSVEATVDVTVRIKIVASSDAEAVAQARDNVLNQLHGLRAVMVLHDATLVSSTYAGGE